MNTATNAVTAKPRRERTKKNLKFANDGSLASVETLLHKVAMKCYARVQAMGLGMSFDDVKQEMYVSYIKAKNCWQPQKKEGALFSTYCTTVCLNNFNNAIKKMEREREKLGMISIEAFSTEEQESYSILNLDHGASTYSSECPEYRLESAQRVQERLNGLSAGAKLLIQTLLQIDQNWKINPPPKLREVAEMAHLDGDELKRVKQEILSTYGVRWQ